MFIYNVQLHVNCGRQNSLIAKSCRKSGNVWIGPIREQEFAFHSDDRSQNNSKGSRQPKYTAVQ